ncbi:MAG: tetratricopeptide (TPR) repeat protein [Brevundimonas sp.]|jgi:tetratricopeptide (TPR) repeat protein|uniref:PIN domain-containing protein n=1 Tax=Brevundimonas sp. TaxID=1871086 RepID=UPI0039E3D759
MSHLAATQIPKPADEQAFERGCLPLWRHILGDPNVQKVGRRGQAQAGVDLWGRRNRDPNHLVGVQCKLKGPGGQLTEKEIHEEVYKALGFTPPLKEFFIVTTAPDSAPLQALARQLTLDQQALGRDLEVHVWGWNTLEDRISESTEARQAFDPSFSPFGAQVVAQVTELQTTHATFAGEALEAFDEMRSQLGRLVSAGLAAQVGDDTRRNAVEAALDGQIDDIRALLSAGDAAVAQAQFERLLTRVGETASGRIRFRIEANIGACQLALGADADAAARLISAFDHAPSEPKAVINKILGLMLQEDWAAALAMGTKALAAGNHDPTLGSYVIQAAHFDNAVEDPLSLVPEALWDMAEVRVAAVNFMRQRGLERWREAARNLVDAFADSEHARRMAAEADLEDGLNDPLFETRRQLPPEVRKRVTAATHTLRELWDKTRQAKTPPREENAGLCANLILGLHVLDDLAAAVEVAGQGMDAFSNDAELARYAAIVGLDAGSEDLVNRVLPLLEQEPAGRLVAFRHYANEGRWTEVERLFADARAVAPASEVAVIEALGGLAALKTSGQDLAAGLGVLLGKVSEDPRAAIVIASAARTADFEAVEDEAFEKARRLLTPDSHIARRLMVARHAVRRGDWSVVADALDGWVETTIDSEELRILARAYTNETPVRRRGTRFFQNLDQALKALPAYSQAEGLFHFNRGALGHAIEPLQRACQAGKLIATLALLEALRRLGRDEEVASTVRGIDPASLRGDPDDKLRFAIAMRTAGDVEGAARFGYEVLRAHPDDPDVAIAYFGLMVGDSGDRLIPAAAAVAIDTWFSVTADNGDKAEFLIVASGARASDHEATPSHPLVEPALGKGVGETFEIDMGLTGVRTWTIKEIKHKYLHAFHDICQNFEARFPTARGLWRITVPEDDITPALDMVKRLGEADDRKADLYLERGLPLSMVGVHVTGGSISFADYVRNRDRDIATAVGLERERAVALEAIEEKRSHGLVLDTYAVWTVATMGALDVLAKVFGTLTIAQSTMDELRRLGDRITPQNGESLSLGWSNGKFTGHRLDADQAAERLSAFNETVSAIEEACVIAPVDAPDALTPLEETIAKAFGPDVLDPAYLAGDCLLLSEDRYYRDAVAQMQGVASAWLQPVLMWAREHDLLSVNEYARHMVKLAARRHGHLGVDVLTLRLIAVEDNSETLSDFTSLCRYLGGPHAEMISHVSIVVHFINGAWSDPDLSPLKAMKATSILLTAMTREKSRPWAQVLAVLRLELQARPARFVLQWAQGHFLPHAELAAAEAELRSPAGLEIRAAIRNYGRREPI